MLRNARRDRRERALESLREEGLEEQDGDAVVEAHASGVKAGVEAQRDAARHREGEDDDELVLEAIHGLLPPLLDLVPPLDGANACFVLRSLVCCKWA